MTIEPYHNPVPAVNPVGVDFYPAGVRLTSPVQSPGNPTGKGASSRGTIRGWSSASRRRMRNFLLSHGHPPGWVACGGTFTLPGPPLSYRLCRQVFHVFQQRINRAGWGMVWRIELQRRGQPHWHCLIILPRNLVTPGYWDGINHDPPEWVRPTIHELYYHWAESVDTLGAFFYHPPITIKASQKKVTAISGLSMWPGAAFNMVSVDGVGGDRGPWLRYLQDHASKTKQEQIINEGRHWGVVGRSRFRILPPSESVNLTDRQYWAVLRSLRRLASPLVKNPAAPFGRSLGRIISRGRFGSSVWFSRPETVQRLCEWAKKYF